MLIKRRTSPFKGYLTLQGGRVNLGETVAQTIIREVKEETGLDVTIDSKIGEYHEKGIQDGLKYDYYPTCFIVKTLTREITEQESEIEEINLFSLAQLPALLAFEHAQMINDSMMRRKWGQQTANDINDSC